MSTNVTEYSARFPLPTMLVRARANTLTLAIESAGSGVTPSSGTVTVADSSGTEFVSAAAITAASPSTYTIGAGVLPATTALDDSWTVRWSITFSSGEVAEYQNIAYLVRRDIHPVVTVSDVTIKDATWEVSTSMSSSESVQTYLDDAWERIQRWLISRGRRPELVMDTYALWDLHIAETLAALYRQAASALNATEGSQTRNNLEFWMAETERLKGDLKLRYDVDEDDLANDEQIGASGSLFLTSGPNFVDTYPLHRRN